MIIGCVAIGGAAMHADVITPEQALERAAAQGPSAVRAKVATKTQPQLLLTARAAERPTAYVFSNAAEAGYMVLSADDKAVPVLGYSDTGSFDPENIPDGLKYWLDLYGREMEYANANGLEPATPMRVQNEFAPIEPLCSTVWGQDTPYNDMCPAIGTSRTVAGCVATAMAQMMKYHQYPAVGTGTGKAKVYNSKGELISNVSVAFGDYPLDWANMTDTYTSASTTAQKDAVATLMYLCGMSVEMQYALDGSGAASAAVASGLIDHFDYDKGTWYAPRDLYSLSQWQQMIYNDLANVGPVVYSGATADNEGHSFVCDGYSSDGYFHFNWGWEGMSDGYYLFTCLNPLEQGTGGATILEPFSYIQDAILGAQPNKGITDEVYCYMYTSGNLSTDVSSANCGSSWITLMGEFWNGSPYTINGTLGIFLDKEDGTSQYSAGTNMGSCEPGGGFGGYYIRLPNNLSDGTYTMTAGWADSDGVSHRMLNPQNTISSFEVVVSSKKATITPIRPDCYVTVTSVYTPSGFGYAGVRNKFELELVNNSSVEFNNSICAGLYLKGSSPASTTAPAYLGAADQLLLDVGDTMEYEYISAFTGAPAGEYVLYFMDPDDYTWYSYGYNFVLEEAPAETEFVITNFQLNGGANEENGVFEVLDASNLNFTFDIECVSGVVDRTFTIGIFRANGKNWNTSFTTPEILAMPGETVAVAAQSSLRNPSFNKQYHAYLYAGTTSSSEQLAGPIDFTYVAQLGVSSIEADDEAVSVEYYNLQGQKVENPTPGLYISVSRYADGTTRSEKVKFK
ncbi:MAG: C10 family peptidase [Bacteroidales bacterium]|nr:C10 family peptidase [Bacteroidales bacterium]